MLLSRYNTNCETCPKNFEEGQEKIRLFLRFIGNEGILFFRRGIKSVFLFAFSDIKASLHFSNTYFELSLKKATLKVSKGWLKFGEPKIKLI